MTNGDYQNLLSEIEDKFIYKEITYEVFLDMLRDLDDLYYGQT